MYDLPPLPRWHSGSVALLGDAAHAMSPSAGQGASMALEDAVLMAKCLHGLPACAHAFAAFQQLRQARVARLLGQTRRNDRRKTPSHPLARRVLELLLPIFLCMGARQTAAAYDHKIDWNELVQPTGVPPSTC